MKTRWKFYVELISITCFRSEIDQFRAKNVNHDDGV